MALVRPAGLIQDTTYLGRSPGRIQAPLEGGPIIDPNGALPMTSSVSASKTASGVDLLTGLNLVDLSGSDRIPIVMEMVAALSRATDAHAVLREFADGFTRLYGPRGYVSLSTRGLEHGQYKVTRVVKDDLKQMAAANPWRDWSQLPVHREGILGGIVQRGEPVIIHDLDLSNDPVIGDELAECHSLMAIPLFDDGQPVNWAITFHQDPKGITVKELEESILQSNLGGAAVKNVLMNQRLREAHAALRYEAEQVAEIQRALLPPIPKIPTLEIGVSYETFGQAGGDMYVLRALRTVEGAQPGEECCDPNGPWGILIADVSGHGTPAAVVMAMVRAIIDAYPKEPEGPGEVLEFINRHVSAKRIKDRFVTAFLAIYDPQTRRLTYSRAGHNPPVWMRPGDNGTWSMHRLDTNGNIPLGIMDEVSYSETAITLSPGESLVFYTDGVTEAQAPDGEMFGVEGIESSLVECTGSPECAISHITGTLKKHQADVRPTDDQTLVVMRVTD